MGLTREQFQALPDLPTEAVDSGPWGTVNVKTLDALELLDLVEFITIPEGATEQEKRRADYETPAKIASRCMVDDNGDRVVQDDEFRILFRKKGASVALGAIMEASNRLNSIFSSAGDDGKNSEPNETGDSLSV